MVCFTHRGTGSLRLCLCGRFSPLERKQHGSEDPPPPAAPVLCGGVPAAPLGGRALRAVRAASVKDL